MIGLDKPASQSALQVVFRCDNNPIMHGYSLLLLFGLYLYNRDIHLTQGSDMVKSRPSTLDFHNLIDQSQKDI